MTRAEDRATVDAASPLIQAGDTTLLGPSAPYLASYVTVGPFQSVAASSQGWLHRERHQARQDAYCLAVRGGRMALVCADGAGSAIHSGQGAAAAARAVAEALLVTKGGVGGSDMVASGPEQGPVTSRARASLWSRLRRRHKPPQWRWGGLPPLADEAVPPVAATLTWLEPPAGAKQLAAPAHRDPVAAAVVWSALEAGHQALEWLATDQGWPLASLHCTVVALVIDTVSGSAAAGQVGDGGLVGLDYDGHASLLLAPGTGGSAGETWFLTQPDWRDRATVADWTPEAASAITMWLLMTDGVADDALYPPPADILDRFGQGLAKELQAPRPLAATAQRLLTWLASYERPGSFDDRTLLAVWRSGQE